MGDRIRLSSLEVANYLGAGSEPVALKCDGQHAVLCGPNGSGKTTILSALDCLRRSLSDFFQANPGLPFLRGHGGAVAGWPYQVDVWEWADAQPHFTADIFHDEAETFRFVAETIVPRELLPAGLRLDASDDPTQFAFDIWARPEKKIRLERLHFGNEEIFRNGASTRKFSRTSQEAPGFIKYGTSLSDSAAIELLGMPGWLLQRTIFFPSYRRPTLGPASDVGMLAGGEGLVNWIKTASNPDPRDAESKRRNALLQEFQEEFAEFIGVGSVHLSVRDYSLPLQNNEQIEINVAVDGRLRLLSQIGAGIGEALIILLVSKLSREWRDPGVDIVLLEEPELHLHPRLQTNLLEQLAKYGVQLIATTHSPTVVNWFTRNRGRVFRTEFREPEQRTIARQVSGLIELRDLIGSIGASPADIVLADKVLLVEGSNDVPVFKAWLKKAPSYASQNIAVLALGGSDVVSRNFDPEQWRSLHPKIRAIIDSERLSAGSTLQKERRQIKAKLEDVGIGCHLTELRSTESYFTPRTLKSVYGKCPAELVACTPKIPAF